MLLHDRLTLDASRRRSGDGYVGVHARAARDGVYDYLGAQVDPQATKFAANDTVKVYRPADEVFSAASLASFIAKPITNDHPSVAVNASNWRDHARGTIMGAVKDGQFVGFDLAFMDQATIAALDSGKRELSNGYSCDISIEDGTAPDGTAYQAVQRNIRGNHVAVVDKGRAGPECRVSDTFALCDSNPSAIPIMTREPPMKKFTLDGLQVDLSDADAVTAAFTKLQGKVTDAETAKATAEAKTVTDAATIVAKDAEITKLTADLAAAKLTPQQMRDAGKAYALVVDKAKASGVTVTDEMDEGAIMKAVVDKAMGDKAKGYSDEYVAIAFEALTKDIKTADQKIVPFVPVNDSADAETSTAYAKMVADMTTAHRPSQAA